jgi:glycosyltransferase involved in cell wall biosynthesis
MKISVIIPFLNLENYLDKCLRSVVNQTLDSSEYEIIAINDCSTDDSCKVVKQYMTREQNIVLLHTTECLGPGNARNIGLNSAKGEFIFFLDGDDYIAETALENLYVTAISKNSDVVSFNYTLVENGRDLSKGGRTDFDKIIANKSDLIKSFLEMKIDGSVIYSFTKRELIEDNNIRFPSGIRFHEDCEFIFMLYYFSRNLTVFDKVLYYKSHRSTSIVNNLTNDHIYGSLSTWIRLYSFLESMEGIENFRAYYPSFLRGYIGIVANMLKRNMAFNSDTDSRDDIYRYIYNFLLQGKVFEGIELPGQSIKDKITKKFFTTFSSSFLPQQAREEFEDYIQCLEKSSS